jgi:DHA2 family metal-tetracycline-proton antiporter-like MFS transporter
VSGAGRFDVAGAGMLLVAVGGLMLATRLPTLTAGPLLAGAVAVGTVGAAAALTVHVVRHPAGFVPLELVRDRVFLTVCACGAALFGTYFSLLFAVPALLGAGPHWSPLQVGVGLLPAGCLGVAGSWLGGRARTKRAPRAAVLLACAGAGLGAAVAAVAAAAWSLILALGVASAALGVGYVLALSTISRRVAQAARGTALGLFNVCFYLAGAVASAGTGMLLETAGTRWALLAVAVVALLGAAAAMTWSHHDDDRELRR